LENLPSFDAEIEAQRIDAEASGEVSLEILLAFKYSVTSSNPPPW
jgi:hypothetical protein